eukprot:COSAG03_NODE_806_length_5772_cov_6.015159_4_plen_327_part_01
MGCRARWRRLCAMPATGGASKSSTAAATGKKGKKGKKDKKGKATRTFGGSTVTVCVGATFVNTRCRQIAIQRTLLEDEVNGRDYTIDIDSGDVGYLCDEKIPPYEQLYGDVVTAAVQLADKSPHMAHRYAGDVRRWNDIPEGETMAMQFDFMADDCALFVLGTNTRTGGPASAQSTSEMLTSQKSVDEYFERLRFYKGSRVGTAGATAPDKQGTAHFAVLLPKARKSPSEPKKRKREQRARAASEENDLTASGAGESEESDEDEVLDVVIVPRHPLVQNNDAGGALSTFSVKSREPDRTAAVGYSKDSTDTFSISQGQGTVAVLEDH